MPETSEQIPSSKLYIFINKERTFSLYFLEGQSLISDLIITHNLQGDAFQFFRNASLSIQPMTALLKQGESFGFYIDSNFPKYHFKLETNSSGKMRCVLKPDVFDNIPENITGIGRLTKILPYQKEPYTSNVELKGLPLAEVVNQILLHSFQLQSLIEVSEVSDQSVMLTRLPTHGMDEDQTDSLPEVKEKLSEIRSQLKEIFAEHYTQPEIIVDAFEKLGFEALDIREIKFECGCSKERLMITILPMYKENPDEWFPENEEEIISQCDYCKKSYRITQNELESFKLN